MTFDRRSIGVYRCDTCSVRQMGHLEELPEGWEDYVIGEGDKAHLGHRCPKCCVGNNAGAVAPDTLQ